jgi:hypothetical protein
MGRGRWLLLAGGGARVRVNGARVQTGIHAIRDRDAIELDGEPACFFSAERLPLAEAFPASTARTLCRRCGLALEPGLPAVRCSVCEAWHHQTVELPCWAALPQCALCGAATAGEEYVWTPAQL